MGNAGEVRMIERETILVRAPDVRYRIVHDEGASPDRAEKETGGAPKTAMKKS